MTKLQGGFKKAELIPEGKHSFVVEQEPYEKKWNKDGKDFSGLIFTLKDLDSRVEYEKMFFAGKMADLFEALKVELDQNGQFYSTEVVGKSFICEVKHIDNKGKMFDLLCKYEPLDTIAWND